MWIDQKSIFLYFYTELKTYYLSYSFKIKIYFPTQAGMYWIELLNVQ